MSIQTNTSKNVSPVVAVSGSPFGQNLRCAQAVCGPKAGTSISGIWQRMT